jgi:hypothetical protein
MDKHEDFLLKCTFVGAPFVGKSELVTAIANTREFSEEYIPTIAVDFGIKYIKTSLNITAKL